jgi:hypothetical protein
MVNDVIFPVGPVRAIAVKFFSIDQPRHKAHTAVRVNRKYSDPANLPRAHARAAHSIYLGNSLQLATLTKTVRAGTEINENPKKRHAEGGKLIYFSIFPGPELDFDSVQFFEPVSEQANNP